MKRQCAVCLRVLLLAIMLTLAGCAGEAAFREGKSLLTAGKPEEALVKLEQSTREAPDNLEFRLSYLNARDNAVAQLLTSATKERNAGHFDEAETLYRRVLKLDPNNAQGSAGLSSLDQARRQAKLIGEATTLIAANDLEAADQKLALVLLDNPQHSEARALRRQIEEKSNRSQVLSPALRKTFKKSVSLEFRDANIKQVLEALSRHSGLNFVMDKDVPSNLITTVFLRQVTVEDALDVILTTLQLDKQVLNDTTLMIYPNTAAKQTERQDLVVKSFYLTNANAKQVMEMLKTVLKVKNVYVDEKLNLLFMRDTPAAIRLAERLVSIQDVAEPEVMLEVEVLEVQRSKLMQLGIQFPDQLTLTPLPSGTTLTLQDLKTMNSSRVGAAISNTVINLHKDIGETNILANPRIRTHNREKAEIKIGDRVPVITSTATATGFVSENVQYVDVGLKLNVEPTIYPDDEVAIRLSLEVSSVVKEVISKAGSLSYQIGSRNASTVLRLKDGETQILGGLINRKDATTANRVPGLGDFPILGRLFSSQKDDNQKTELVLSITPHLVRGIAPPLNMPTEFWSGTENNLRMKPLSVSAMAKNKIDTDDTNASAPANAVSTGVNKEIPATEGQAPQSADTEDQPLINTSTSKAPILRWEGAAQTKTGDKFNLLLNVSSQQAITGFPLQVKYDPAVLEVVDAIPAGFLTQGDGKVDFTKRIVAGSGIVFLTQNRQATEGAKGDGGLIELQFRALKPSTSSLITALPATPMGGGNRPLETTGPAMIGISVTP
jgi:general secretion pathway protein D